MSELFAGLIGLFILFVFGLLFIGVPIAIIMFFVMRKRHPRAPQPQRQRQGAGEFGGALDRDDNFTHNLSGGAYSSSVESSSSWDSSSGSSSDW